MRYRVLSAYVFKAMNDFSIGQLPDKDGLRLSGRIVIIVSTILCFWALLYSGMFYFYLESTTGGLILLCALLAVIVSVPLALHFAKTPDAAGSLLMLIMSSAIAGAARVSGGYGTPPLYWCVVIPVAATCMLGIRGGVLWSGVAVTEVLGFYIAGRHEIKAPPPFPKEKLEMLEVTSSLGAMLCLVSIALIYEIMHRRATESVYSDRDSLHSAVQRRNDELSETRRRLRFEIAQRQQCDLAVRLSEEQYRSLTDQILDGAAVGLFIMDQDLKVV